MINHIKIEDAIYIAGLFDGEGSIGLNLLDRKSKLEQGKTSTCTLRVRVRMTDGNIIKWLYATIGGRYYEHKPTKLYLEKGWKPYFEWGVVGEEAVAFLHIVYPHLRVKRLQAEIAFKYGETISTIGYKKRMSADIVLMRNDLRQQMLVLNKRGCGSPLYDKKPPTVNLL